MLERKGEPDDESTAMGQQGTVPHGQTSHLIERFAPMIYRRALAILTDREEARDATQDVFIKVLCTRRLERVDAGHSSFLYRVVTNTCLNRLRDRRRRQSSLQRNQQQPEQCFVADAELKSLAIDLLLKTERAAAVAALCVHIQEMSREETAALLGVSPRTVGNLLSRFRCEARRRG